MGDLKLGILGDYYDQSIRPQAHDYRTPVRCVITRSDSSGYDCEVDVIVPESDLDVARLANAGNIFDFRRRQYESTKEFTAVLLIPTGIGAELGGHCGDGNALARLLATACDTLITHPNVVNASDINEMRENTLYVEGSLITRLLRGKIGLQRVRQNRVLMMMDKHPEPFFNDEIVNAVSSARVTLGMDCDVFQMHDLISCTSCYSKSGRAGGKIEDLEKLFEVIDRVRANYDAFGFSTFIRVPNHYHKKYFADDAMVNPWGGIEAMLTHSIAEIFNVPCAHSPMMTSSEVMEIELGIVDPRKAPESASISYLHSVLKGLHNAPRVVHFENGTRLEDISCLIIPDGCVGIPILACLENHIPVIAVRENRNNMKNDLTTLNFKHGKLFIVENYWEAVGVMLSLKGGVSPGSVRRPLTGTSLV